MADSQEYLRFDVEISRSPTVWPGTARTDAYLVSVDSEAGQAEGHFYLPFAPEQTELELLRIENVLLRATQPASRSAAAGDEELLRSFGRRLFEAVFSTEVRMRYAATIEQANTAAKGVRLRLLLRAPELTKLPWELLWEPESAEFVALSNRMPFTRYLRGATSARPLNVSLPLRVLGVSASPRGLDKLDIAREEAQLRAALSELGSQVQLTWIHGTTRESLRRNLTRTEWHVLHFAGHGGYDDVAGEGFVVLEGDQQAEDRFSASMLGMLLRDQPQLRLVVLSACECARTGRAGPGADTAARVSSTAAKLVEIGVPAVVGMQYPVSDPAAIDFSRVLYETIMVGLPIDGAVAEARKALRLRNSFEWVTPILFMRAADGLLFRFDANNAVSLPSSSSVPAARATPPAPAGPEPVIGRLPASLLSDPRSRQRLVHTLLIGLVPLAVFSIVVVCVATSAKVGSSPFHSLPAASAPLMPSGPQPPVAIEPDQEPIETAGVPSKIMPATGPTLAKSRSKPLQSGDESEYCNHYTDKRCCKLVANRALQALRIIPLPDQKLPNENLQTLIPKTLKRP